MSFCRCSLVNALQTVLSRKCRAMSWTVSPISVSTSMKDWVPCWHLICIVPAIKASSSTIDCAFELSDLYYESKYWDFQHQREIVPCWHLICTAPPIKALSSTKDCPFQAFDLYFASNYWDFQHQKETAFLGYDLYCAANLSFNIKERLCLPGIWLGLPIILMSRKECLPAFYLYCVND